MKLFSVDKVESDFTIVFIVAASNKQEAKEKITKTLQKAGVPNNDIAEWVNGIRNDDFEESDDLVIVGYKNE